MDCKHAPLWQGMAPAIGEIVRINVNSNLSGRNANGIDV